MTKYKIHSVELSSIEQGICEELKGETFEAKNKTEAWEKAHQILKERLGNMSEESFNIDYDKVKDEDQEAELMDKKRNETVELQSGMKI